MRHRGTDVGTSRDQRRGDDLPAETPPGPDGLPVLGNALPVVRDPQGFYDRLREYGDVVRYRLPRLEFCALLHPEHVERVLLTDHEKFGKYGFEEFVGSFASDGLLLSEGEQWRRQRTAVQNAFTPDRIHGYGDAMARFADELADEWDDGEEVALERAFSDLSLRILTHSLFDLEVGADVSVASEFAAAINELGRLDGLSTFLPTWVPTAENRRYWRARSEFRSFVDGLVAERRGRADEYDDLLSLLLTAEDDEGATMSETEIRDQMVTFLFAGHETTTLALTYTVLELAKRDDVRERLDAEYEAVLGGDAPTLADLGDLSYTEKVIQESLRRYPPVYLLFREAREPAELGGYRIPEGTKLSLPTFYLHTDERWYDDPETFDPDRWTDRFERDLPDFAYFPFGGGPRLCIGRQFALLELQTVVPTLVQQFEFELLSDPDPDLDMGTTLRPAEAVRVRVHER